MKWRELNRMLSTRDTFELSDGVNKALVHFTKTKGTVYAARRHPEAFSCIVTVQINGGEEREVFAIKENLPSDSYRAVLREVVDKVLPNMMNLEAV